MPPFFGKADAKIRRNLHICQISKELFKKKEPNLSKHLNEQASFPKAGAKVHTFETTTKYIIEFFKRK